MPERHPWIAADSAGNFVATFPPIRTDEETEAFWDRLEHHFDSGEAPERFGVVLDLRAIRSSSTRARARMAGHLRDYDAFHTRHCVGLAVVVRSTVARAAVQAVVWMIPHRAAPMRVFESVASAEAWLHELWAREVAAPAPPPA